MTDYQKYINALRKCAKEHENDKTSTGHVIVSDLCRDTSNLLEELSNSEKPNKSEIPTGSTTKSETLVSLDSYNQVAKERDIAIQQLHELGYEFGQKIEPITKDCLAVGQIVDEVIKKVMPIKPKGHWILTDVEGNKVWHCHCSECGEDPQDYVGGSENWWLIKSKLPKFCPSCGSDNREVGK